MVEFLIRLLICLAIMAAGFAIFISRSSSEHRHLWLLFPLVGAVPASLAAALLFVPIETFAYSRGLDHWATPAVVLAGASIAFLFEFLARLHERPGRFGKPARSPFRLGHFVRAASVWIVLGASWGALWRASAIFVP